MVLGNSVHCNDQIAIYQSLMFYCIKVFALAGATCCIHYKYGKNRRVIYEF